MTFNELFNEFEQLNIPTYVSRIRSLQNFLSEEKQINDDSYRTYLKAMTLQMREYIRIRNGIKTESKKLFIKSNDKELSGTCNLDSILKVIDRKDTRGIIKYTIINMIKANIGQHLIMELTEVGNTVYNYCLEVVNGNGRNEKTRIVDTKLRSISTFDLL